MDGPQDCTTARERFAIYQPHEGEAGEIGILVMDGPECEPMLSVVQDRMCGWGEGDDTGITAPPGPGLWAWEGTSEADHDLSWRSVRWEGAWRRLHPSEIVRLGRGERLWSAP